MAAMAALAACAALSISASSPDMYRRPKAPKGVTSISRTSAAFSASLAASTAYAAGSEVTTIEGLAEQPGFERLEAAFTRHAALQCGFCTPGMLLTVSALLESGELVSEEEIKRSLAGNLCRCTGYRGILEAVAELAGVA